MAKFQVGDKVTIISRFDRNGSVCWFNGEVESIIEMEGGNYYLIRTAKTGEDFYVSVNSKDNLYDCCFVAIPRIEDLTEIFLTCIRLASLYIERRRIRLTKHIAREAVKSEKEWLKRELESLAMMQVVESHR
jgi:hypothetical protein